MKNKKVIGLLLVTVLPANLFLIAFISKKIDANSVICCSVMTLGVLGGILLLLKKGYVYIGGKLVSLEKSPSHFYASVCFFSLLYVFTICGTIGIYYQKIKH